MKTNNLIVKVTLVFTLLFYFAPPTHAWERPEINIRIILSLVDIHPDPLHPRTPIETPQVGQTEHTLYFLDETTLVLNIFSEDEAGNEVLEYTTNISTTTTSIELPSDLTGTFIIEVIRDGQHFRGEIEL